MSWSDEVSFITQHTTTCGCKRCLQLDPSRWTPNAHTSMCQCKDCVNRRGATIVVLSPTEAQRLAACRAIK